MGRAFEQEAQLQVQALCGHGTLGALLGGLLGGTLLLCWLRPAVRARLPRYVDAELRHVTTRAQLDACITRGRAGCQPLLPRGWTGDRRTGGVGIVRVLQFNTLARGLSAGPLAPTPFRPTLKSDFGGFDEVEAPEAVLDWGTRRWSVLAEILRQEPDLISLQEVDHFADFFQPALVAAGYDSLFQPVSAPGPGERYGYYTDGVALAWRRDRFAIARVNAARSAAAGRASLVLTLAPHLKGSRPIVLAGVHLAAKAGQVKEDLRAAQLGALLVDIERARAAAGRAKSPVVIVAGDFNSDPHDVVAKEKSAGGGLTEGHVAKTVPKLLAYGLRSAYALAEAKAGFGAGSTAWTTWKRRQLKTSKHQIDYICCSGARVLETLMPPTDADVGGKGLPSARYPSDHLAIAADLEVEADEAPGGL
ncbi:Endonuclease/exonuclease/phosphatase [Pavlovales sp. CCMP2436]|nr:Endonuclease/exonuclease/phosphatase [Pavlovales sp. CCMP2436]